MVGPNGADIVPLPLAEDGLRRPLRGLIKNCLSPVDSTLPVAPADAASVSSLGLRPWSSTVTQAASRPFWRHPLPHAHNGQSKLCRQHQMQRASERC
eukprot:CAMPEP_0204324402 /NCGR_PEP_ID=MMETSP0469-20131031/10196_1 /ASSEMBLY_ACC=CAM_ASM_000384 /TAXON_ID=2969 /ORGANISM="Oxyrrhis marina" /LENGTH=96 /DNA_ID=CAMNT_0051306053 /DNA_START=177 /DNA_END=467 /DNA_ORIENTATION=+